MNSINLVGRLTAKPELRYTQSNKAVCNYNLAVNRSYTDSEGERIADFIPCQVWGKYAENLAKYQDKGSLIGVTGELRVEQYQDTNGNKRYKTYVAVSNIEYLEKKKEQTSEQTSEQINNQVQEEYNDPFAEYGENVTIDDNFLD